MNIMEAVSFFEAYPREIYYVGFLKSKHSWFPLSFVANPEDGGKLDSLFLATNYPAMSELVREYSRRIPDVEDSSVQILLKEEIQNILEGYSLRHIGLTGHDGEVSGCGCGCGCG